MRPTFIAPESRARNAVFVGPVAAVCDLDGFAPRKGPARSQRSERAVPIQRNCVSHGDSSGPHGGAALSLPVAPLEGAALALD